MQYYLNPGENQVQIRGGEALPRQLAILPSRARTGCSQRHSETGFNIEHMVLLYEAWAFPTVRKVFKLGKTRTEDVRVHVGDSTYVKIQRGPEFSLNIIETREVDINAVRGLRCLPLLVETPLVWPFNSFCKIHCYKFRDTGNNDSWFQCN